MKNSSTNKKDTGKLEDVFQQAFEGAREEPPGDLWTRLDHQLQAQEAVGLRGRVAWYRRVAAACLVLLLCLGTFTYVTNHEGQPDRPELAQGNHAQTPSGNLNEGPESSSRQQTGPEASYQVPGVGDQQKEALVAGDPRGATSRLSQPSQPEQVGASPRALTPLPPQKKGKASNVTARINSPTSTDRRPTSTRTPQQADHLAPKTTEPGLAFQETGRPYSSEDVSTGENPISETEVAPLPARALPTAVNTPSESLVVLPKQQPADSLDQGRPDRVRSGEDLLPESLKRSRWSVGGSYGAHYFAQNIALRNDFSGSGRMALSNASPIQYAFAPPNNFDQAVDEFIQNTRAGQSFGATVQGGYQLDRHWRMETGFTFSQNESQTKTSYLVSGMQIMYTKASRLSNNLDMLSDYESLANMPVTTIMLPALAGLDGRDVSVNKTNEFTTRYRYRFVGLPLQLVFQSRQTRSFVFASAGVSPQLLVESTLQTDSPLAGPMELSAGKGSPFRRVNASGSASLGYGYRMSDGFSLMLGPEVKSFLVPLVRSTGNTAIQQGRPFNLGLHLTARYQFKR